MNISLRKKKERQPLVEYSYELVPTNPIGIIYYYKLIIKVT